MQRKEDERRRQEKKNESKGKPKESRNGKNRQAVIPQREIEIKEKIDLCLRRRNFLDSVLIESISVPPTITCCSTQQEKGCLSAFKKKTKKLNLFYSA